MKETSTNTNNLFQSLLKQQAGEPSNNVDIITLKATYKPNQDSEAVPISALKNRKIKVVKKDPTAKVCLIKKDGNNVLFSNIADEIPSGAEVMQIEEQPSLPDQPLLPSIPHSRQDRVVDFMYSSFGSHLPNKDTTAAVLGERESRLFDRHLLKKRAKLEKLKYVDSIDIDSEVYSYVEKTGNSKLLNKIKKSPNGVDALDVKIEFILQWLHAIERLKDPLDPTSITEQILTAIYRRTLVEHVTACSKSKIASRHVYKHPNSKVRAMMDRLIVKIPPFQGNLSCEKPFAFTSNLIDGIPNAANSGAEYPLKAKDVENYCILKDISHPSE